MDFRIHTHASYATCNTADYLRIAGAYSPEMNADNETQAGIRLSCW